ncbi:Chromatin remodeling factor mit1 [Golovinomyces cichoracearum]|uniref:Chromatin remodeling factor mit1 n=1 Tax=Golovinomyces cichoracearum TaxID=62708 RepID=A0A420IKV6_9PEZI|nr:Chromatin remodeling factor mit1 [Golovinomyces cichoracearum]
MTRTPSSSKRNVSVVIPSNGQVSTTSRSRRNIAVIVPGPKRKWEYTSFSASTTAAAILEELDGSDGHSTYRIEYSDGNKEEVSLVKLLSLKNGQKVLDQYKKLNLSGKSHGKCSAAAENTIENFTEKRSRRKIIYKNFVDSFDIDSESHESLDKSFKNSTKKRRLRSDQHSSVTQKSPPFTRSRSVLDNSLSARRGKNDINDPVGNTLPSGGSNDLSTKIDLTELRTPACRSHASTVTTSSMRKKSSSKFNTLDDESDELGRSEQKLYHHRSFIRLRQTSKRKYSTRQNDKTKENTEKAKSFDESFESSSSYERPSRRSCRKTNRNSMKDIEEDKEDFFSEEEFQKLAPKVANIQEIFGHLSKHDSFRLFHRKTCDVCNGKGNHSKRGTSPLVFCQGCSISMHKICLGHRGSRDHTVTKVGFEDFVMQCRRCIGAATNKDKTGPRLDVCFSCREVGPSCAPFSTKKSARQEEKLRQENEGVDPITRIPTELLNNSKNVLFRCKNCHRASHFEHLPPRRELSTPPHDIEKLRKLRLNEYSSDWLCKHCHDAPANVHRMVCWRPPNSEKYHDERKADELCEDDKEYLIKWTEKSYFECNWMPGSWVWGVTTPAMRKSFYRRDDGINMYPIWNFEDAVPEEFLRIEIVFDVRYVKGFIPKSEKSDNAAIDMITSVFVKFQGLSYEDASWVEPPKSDNFDRYQNYVSAYNEYLAGKYFKQSSTASMEQRLKSFRKLKFSKKIEFKEKPSGLTGGQMMPYQMEGLNWLLYNFYQKKNVILADEMGLGKTIQIIALLTALVKNSPKCWPFLVVTPNSTCPNWRREIKKWAPSLRVVSYYGGRITRELAMRYEMYPQECSYLKAHVIITSFETPTDEHSRNWFTRIKWAGLVVDEGQRLKNDRNLLYATLKGLKIPFQVLLTGTPLQNNKRELFNLLQFLDNGIDAAKLDEEYKELTNQNLPQLHELIRPFILRRTKLQVLKFLPSVTQMIIPVTMSVVQKKLYKSILAKNLDSIKSVFGQHDTTSRTMERGNLNNVLMQLRKCLCHPFLYSSAIEERSLSDQVLFRNLVDASSKFKLLEIMLPKLFEHGHRVLIFSQFLNYLDLIEDFLTGLELPFQRLDGNTKSLEKQKRIDAFNAPDSPFFAFLLSTRAGGVGINLVSADTVLIMDPDFNPHQDIQALSRAHRIGQEKKVLVFQLMTKDSAEEKIIQIGRRKLALDQALIRRMDDKNDCDFDVESILRFGAEALFNEDHRNDIHYDSASVDKLLDRTINKDNAAAADDDDDDEKSGEVQFSFARIWSKDKDSIIQYYDDDEDSPDTVPQFSAWDKILEQREADAALESAKSNQNFGRGKRSRQIKNYGKYNHELEDETFISPNNNENSGQQDEIDKDLDFSGVLESLEEEEDSDYEQNKSARKKRKSQKNSSADCTLSPEAQYQVGDKSHQEYNQVVNLSPKPNIGASQIVTKASKIFPSNHPLQPPHIPNSCSYQSQGFHCKTVPNTLITNYEQHQYGEAHWYNYQGKYFPQETINTKLPNYPTYPLLPIQVLPAPFSIGDGMCTRCGLLHLYLSRICPVLASDTQIRLMLDKLVRFEKMASQKEKMERILRLHLFDRLRRKKNCNDS